MQFSFLETFYVILAITNIMLDTRQSILARPLGLINACISLYIYCSVSLYAKCLLKCIFIVLNIYGWYQWLYGGTNKTPLKVSLVPPSQLAAWTLVGLLGSGVLGQLLTRYSNADLPYWDSLHTVLALIAYWLLVNKKLETWAVWMLTDTLYAGVLGYKGLYLLSGLHLFYLMLAINGYRTWRQSYRLAQPPASF